MNALYEIEKGEHKISIFEQHKHVMLIIDQGLSRCFVKAELGMIGYTYRVNVFYIPGFEAMMATFPGSAEVCYDRIMNSKIFGWE